jgi:hypothetical protein
MSPTSLIFPPLAADFFTAFTSSATFLDRRFTALPADFRLFLAFLGSLSNLYIMQREDLTK